MTDGTTRLPPSPCPHCGYGTDAASTLDGSPKQPRPGDMSLCLNCGAILTFFALPDGGLALRSARAEDLDDCDPVDLDAIRKCSAIIMQRGPIPRLARRRPE